MTLDAIERIGRRRHRSYPETNAESRKEGGTEQLLGRSRSVPAGA